MNNCVLFGRSGSIKALVSGDFFPGFSTTALLTQGNQYPTLRARGGDRPWPVKATSQKCLSR
jgi:hypothetical protein